MKRWWSKPIYHHITFYNEGSSLNDQYSKNNLGIIYKNGFGNVIKKNLSMAKVLFEEAIYQKNDKVAMYILSHMYFYDNSINYNIDECIKLLIKSSI